MGEDIVNKGTTYNEPTTGYFSIDNSFIINERIKILKLYSKVYEKVMLDDIHPVTGSPAIGTDPIVIPPALYNVDGYMVMGTGLGRVFKDGLWETHFTFSPKLTSATSWIKCTLNYLPYKMIYVTSLGTNKEVYVRSNFNLCEGVALFKNECMFTMHTSSYDKDIVLCTESEDDIKITSISFPNWGLPEWERNDEEIEIDENDVPLF